MYKKKLFEENVLCLLPLNKILLFEGNPSELYLPIITSVLGFFFINFSMLFKDPG